MTDKEKIAGLRLIVEKLCSPEKFQSTEEWFSGDGLKIIAMILLLRPRNF
jgi:hypothetical protein